MAVPAAPMAPAWKYKVVVAAVEETKQFGSGVYRVGNSVVVTTGGQAPEDMVSSQGG